MKFCTCATPVSPVEAPRPSLHNCDEPSKELLAPTQLVRKPSKLQTTMEVTRCRFGNKSRQAAPTGYEDFVPQKAWTPIYHAVYHDREAALRHFLQTGAPMEDTEGTGIPLLCIAAACGHFEITKLLLEAGAEINACSKEKGETALHIAVRRSQHNIIDLLLGYRVDVEARTVHTGETALHYAAAGCGSLALVMKLLKSGAKYESHNVKGQTPAAVALEAHNLHAAVAIINMARGKRTQLAKEKDLLLQHVEKTKDRSSLTNDLIADVFAATCDPDSTVLVEAIKKNDARLVDMFLEKGADPHRATAKGLLPIFVAIKFADLPIMKLLVKYGADVTEQGPGDLNAPQVLLKTCTTRSEESIVAMVDYLLAKGANSSVLYPDGKTLLHRAVTIGPDHAKVAKSLLKVGIEINAQDSNSNTALHLSAIAGLANTTRLLLDSRADSTIINSNKQTPLLCAVQHQQWHIVPRLAVPPAITSWDADGSTALHRIAQSTLNKAATWTDVAAAVKPFCGRGVCRSMRDRSGATPLIQAIKTLPEGGLPIVETLLNEGGENRNCVGHEDHKGHDALYYAATLGKPVFVEALIKYGAPVAHAAWVDGKKSFRIPAGSRAQILELIDKSDSLRQAHIPQKQHSPDPEIRVDPVTTEKRSSSVMSGYHADWETDRETKPPRNNLRKVSSAQYLQVPVLRQKQKSSPKPIPDRTTSIQQQPGRISVRRSQPQLRSHFAISPAPVISKADQNVPAEARSKVSKHRPIQPKIVVEKLPTIPGSRDSSLAFSAHSARSSNRQPLPVMPARPIPEAQPVAPVAVPLPESKSLPIPPPKQSVLVDKPNVVVANTVKPESRPVQNQTSPIETPKVIVVKVAKPNLPSKPVTPPTTPPKPIEVATPATTPKPVQPARADSGVNLAEDDSTAKSLPPLDRSKNTLDGSVPKVQRQSGDELASWLAISNMLDRI